MMLVYQQQQVDATASQGLSGKYGVRGFPTIKLLKEGKTIMSYSDSGTNVSKQFTMPVKEVLAECKMALQQLDPATYGKRTTIIRTDWRQFDGF